MIDYKKALARYKNTAYVYQTVEACEKLIKILTANANEFPDVKYNTILKLCEELVQLKYSALSLLKE